MQYRPESAARGKRRIPVRWMAGRGSLHGFLACRTALSTGTRDGNLYGRADRASACGVTTYAALIPSASTDTAAGLAPTMGPGRADTAVMPHTAEAASSSAAANGSNCIVLMRPRSPDINVLTCLDDLY